eukprot:747951-Hanusia_phi.AAC.5
MLWTQGREEGQGEVKTCPLLGPFILVTSTPPSTPASLKEQGGTGPLQLPSRITGALPETASSTMSRPL